MGGSTRLPASYTGLVGMRPPEPCATCGCCTARATARTRATRTPYGFRPLRTSRPTPRRRRRCQVGQASIGQRPLCLPQQATCW
jgi:hypothetical protein